MKKFKLFLANLSVAMLISMMVICIVSERNPLMMFLSSRTSTVFIFLMSLIGIATAVMYICDICKRQ